MIHFMLTWINIQKKWLLLFLLGSIFFSVGNVFFQQQKAQEWEAQHIKQIDTWYENTKMELIRGEANPWNNYIGSLLSDLGLLKSLWMQPDLYKDQILECENSYYSKAIQDAGYCHRILGQEVSNLTQKLELAEAYKEKNWEQPLNSEEPRADFMVYEMDHYFSGIVLFILGMCCGIGGWIWAWMSESKEYMLLFSLPFSKGKIFASLMLLNIGISLFFLCIQYGSLWIIGWILKGNLPLMVVENGQIVSCSLAAIQNLKYSISLCFFFSCLSALISVWIGNIADTLIILVIILMALYFLFSKIVWFDQILSWFWWFLIVLNGLSIFLTWKQFKYVG